MLSLDTKLADLPSIQKTYLPKLERLGIVTVRDLFFHLPHRYEDFSAVRPIASLTPGEKCTLEVEVKDFRENRSFQRRMLVSEALVSDSSGTLRVVWFNQRYLKSIVKPGMKLRLSGKITEGERGLSLTNPETERSGRDATHTARLVPVYPETRGLTSRFLRWQITELFEKCGPIEDPVPEDMLARLSLPPLGKTLRYLHFPRSREEVLFAEKRLAFDDMLALQLKALEVRALSARVKAAPLKPDKKALRTFLESLPFRPTGAQERAIEDITRDLAKSRPMNRLVNGDVGSGKTLVAAAAVLPVVKAGGQAALLAPTEVLARQHYETLTRLFASFGLVPALFTGSARILDGETVSRKTMLKAVEAGIPPLIVGTHALIQPDIRFHKLSLVVVDEQHRFGVAQRAALQEKSFQAEDGAARLVPHFLTMTATPIPRTLTLAFFGNLDISLLDEMPPGRTPVKTRVIKTAEERARCYAFVDRELSAGRQAFIIFPLVEESLALKGVLAAVAEHARLAEEVFPHRSIGLLHGKMKPQEKEAVMQDFKNGRYDILVATAVVEVGVDVPNASVILIEEAERFGLSQLHQFRGRVGRGEAASYCFLLPGTPEASDNARLGTLERETSGFAIAEADLALRGPGAFLGTRQSGLPDIAMEHLSNMRLIDIARREAEGVLADDPELQKHPGLRTLLERFEERVHLE
jgi:ATP-dependent DNA helicase RecG